VEVKCLYDKLVDPNKLKPHPKNRNIHSEEQIQRLAKIIKYQGWRYPVKVSKQSGFITSGHGRIAAAKILKCKVPVNIQTYESDEQEYADVQSDNAIASWAELDLSGINSDLGDLGPDFDIELLGLKDFTIEVADKDPGCDEDDVPDVKEPISKPGDLYVLGGRHRLLCGDSTNIQHVELLMDGQRSDMVFTDPPYGMNLDTDYSKMSTTSKDYRKVIGDNSDFDPGIIFGEFDYCGEIFLWGADYYAERLIDKNKGSWIVWDKCTESGIDTDWSGKFGSEFELCWSKSKHQRSIVRKLTATGFFARGDEKKIHPTQKPVKLAEWFIEKFGKDKNNIADLFGGSGSTLIACEKTNRNCFMMELDAHYIDVIVSRYCKYTKTNKVIRNGEEIEWGVE